MISYELAQGLAALRRRNARVARDA